MSDAEKIKELEKSNAYLVTKLDSYENGDLSLYHAIQRKMKELSKILNKYDLGEVNIDDKESKKFERLSVILEKCEKYALSANALGARLGLIVNVEQPKETNVHLLRSVTTPESISNVLGNSAGQRS